MNKKYLIFSLLILIIFSSGCLKDTKYSEIDKTAPIVEFPIGGPGVVENVYDGTDISKNRDTSFAINIASPQGLGHEVQVTVQVTPTIVTEYNTVSGSTYTPLPASNYSIENYTITIPKGYRIGRFKIKLLFPKFDLNQTYALGLQIVNAPGLTISGNFNKFLWSFNLRNKYDGVYTVNGSFLDVLNPTAFTPALPTTVYLITTGTYSVSVNRAVNGAIIPAYTFFNAGASTYYGNFGAVFNFDANDNLSTVTNYYGQGVLTQGRSAAIDPTGGPEGKNKFFTANHSIKAKYFMLQPDISTIRAKFDETYTYVGPR